MSNPSNRKGKTYEEIYGPERGAQERMKRQHKNSKPSERLGKTYIEIYGLERAKIEAKKRGDSNKGRIVTVEQRNRIRETLRTTHGTRGKTYEEIYGPERVEEQKQKRRFEITPEHRQAMAERARGRVLTSEQRRKLSESHIGKHNMRHWDNRPESSLERIVREVLKSAAVELRQEEPLFWFNADFYLPSCRGVIEVDGAYWHSKPDAVAWDIHRDKFLHSHGYKVVRISEQSLLVDPVAAVSSALQDLGETPMELPPRQEKRRRTRSEASLAMWASRTPEQREAFRAMRRESMRHQLEAKKKKERQD